MHLCCSVFHQRTRCQNNKQNTSFQWVCSQKTCFCKCCHLRPLTKQTKQKIINEWMVCRRSKILYYTGGEKWWWEKSFSMNVCGDRFLGLSIMLAFYEARKDAITHSESQLWGVTLWHLASGIIAMAQVITVTAFPSARACCVYGLLSLWRCSPSAFKRSQIKPKSVISMSVNYRQSHLSSQIRLVLLLRNLHKPSTLFHLE